ncbi:MAG TPA: hypothetical protein VN769_06935 [Xanthobacteraceae bacterium]|nr:hypothetical protein [Xanthobacteraceae bacterium]
MFAALAIVAATVADWHGSIHLPQPFGAEIAKPVHNLGVTAALFFSAFFDKPCGSVEKFWARKMLLQSNGAHTRSSDLY